MNPSLEAYHTSGQQSACSCIASLQASLQSKCEASSNIVLVAVLSRIPRQDASTVCCVPILYRRHVDALDPEFLL